MSFYVLHLYLDSSWCCFKEAASQRACGSCCEGRVRRLRPAATDPALAEISNGLAAWRRVQL